MGFFGHDWLVSRQAKGLSSARWYTNVFTHVGRRGFGEGGGSWEGGELLLQEENRTPISRQLLAEEAQRPKTVTPREDVASCMSAWRGHHFFAAA